LQSVDASHSQLVGTVGGSKAQYSAIEFAL
jgi:hypothetical protein